jgi:hypothetical protein
MEKPAPEERTQRIFGELEYAQLRANPDLAKFVMKVVNEACAARKREPSVKAVADGLISGRFKLWGVMGKNASLDAIAVTERKDAVMEIVVVGPRFEDFAPFMPMLEKIARGQRCDRVVMGGPHIFKRWLPEGWTQRTEIKYERLLGGAG